MPVRPRARASKVTVRYRPSSRRRTGFQSFCVANAPLRNRIGGVSPALSVQSSRVSAVGIESRRDIESVLLSWLVGSSGTLSSCASGVVPARVPFGQERRHPLGEEVVERRTLFEDFPPL